MWRRASERGPERAGNWGPPGGHQHQRRVAVGKRAHYPRTSPDLTHDGFQWVVGADLPPMLRRKLHVAERLFNALSHRVGRLAQPHALKLLDHVRRLLPRRLAVFLGVDRLKRCHVTIF